MGFLTDAVHGGQEPEERTGAVMTPIFQTSTYKQDGLGDHRGYEYARTQNPTREAWERNIAVLERGEHGIAYASGMSATNSILYLLKAGDHVVVSQNVYGGVYRLAEMVLARFGLTFSWVDTTNLDEVRAAINDNTRMIYIESPTNPVLTVTDIAGCADLAKGKDILLAVDNTFMSPFFQNPLELGADIVVHSTTKYLNGHSDMIGGVVVTRSDDLAERFRFLQNAAGAVPGPFDCWLALRGTKTLALRMRQHDANARHLAEALSGHKTVDKLYYPGLPDHPQHDLQKRQARGFGGVISVDVGSLDKAKQFLARTRLFTLAESLGGVESLISHPASMTHATVPPEERDRIGVTEGLVRLSVGIEDPEDLLADIEQALA